MPSLARILAAAHAIGAALFAAVADGRITAEEAADIHRVTLDELGALAADVEVDDVIAGLVAKIEALFRRDPANMRKRAAAKAAEGKHERAAELLEDAAKVERRQGDGDAA